VARGSWSSYGNGFGASGSGLAMLCCRPQTAYGAQKSFLFFYGHEELTAWHLTDATAMNDNAIEPRDSVYDRVFVCDACVVQSIVTMFTIWSYISSLFLVSEAAHLLLPLDILQRHLSYPIARHKKRFSRFLA
jgi:hypothetical protein